MRDKHAGQATAHRNQHNKKTPFENQVDFNIKIQLDFQGGGSQAHQLHLQKNRNAAPRKFKLISHQSNSDRREIQLKLLGPGVASLHYRATWCQVWVGWAN